MTEIRFYHLQSKTLEQALPEILNVACGRGHRAVVIAGSAQRVQAFDKLLWTFNPQGFLPHGSKRDGHEADQPVWLTTEDENPNGADLLILTDGATSQKLEDYKICCEMFDGRDEAAVKAARERWKSYKDAGFALKYYQQDDRGRWQEKAAA